MKRVGWAVVTLAVVAVAAAAIGVRLIDTPAVRAEIQARLSAALGGQIEWQALEVRFLPAPHVELRRVSIEIPGALSARADDVNIYMRFWPLLRGRAEIASLSVSRPEVLIGAAAGARKDGGPFDALAAYRSVVEPLAQALRKFAPHTEIRIEAATLALPGLQLRGLDALARTAAEGLDLRLDGASNLWKRLRIEGRIADADLSARVEVELDGLVVDADLPAVTLKARVSTDAKTSIQAQGEGALGSLVPEFKAELLLPAGKPAELSAQLSQIDLPAALAIGRRKLPGFETLEAAEGRLSANVGLSLGAPWRAQLDIVRSDAVIKVAQLPWKVSVHAGRASVTEKEVHLAGLRGALGESGFSDVAARLDLGKPLRLSAASGRATLKLEQWFAWLRPQLAQLEEITTLSGSVEVALQRVALRFDRPAEVAFDATATPRQVSATLKSLPAPLSVSAGSLQINAAQVRMDRLAVAMLDARALVSGSVATKGPKVELALAEGALGEKIVQWGLARGEVPARFEPRTPLRFAAKRIAWAPGAPLQAEASVEFEGGPGVAAALTWQPEKLDLRRLTIKDARSDVVLGATIGADVLQASFSGTLYGRSLASILRKPLASAQGDLGVARGKLLLKGHRKAPIRKAAKGLV